MAGRSPCSIPTATRLAAAETAFADENAIFLAADVTDEDEIADVFDQVVDRLGLVGGLVNAAGLLKSLPAEDTTAELLREMLDVNLVGSFIAAKAALERMGASLSIVNIGSVSGLRANRGRLAYGAAAGRREADVGSAGARIWQPQRAGELRRAWRRSKRLSWRARIRPRNGGRGLPMCHRPATESPRKSPPRSPSCCRRKRATSTATR